MSLTGGKVTYRRVVRPADFESKEFICELAFDAGDGDIESLMARAGDMAVAETHYRLGLSGKPGYDPDYREPSKGPMTLGDLDAGLKAAVAASEPEKPARRQRAPKLGSVEALKEAAAKAAVVEPDPLLGELHPQKSDLPAGEKPSAVGVSNGADLLDAAMAEISDAELLEHAQATAGRLKDGGPVRRLIQEKFGVPQMSMLPQAKRQAFVDALKELK